MKIAMNLRQMTCIFGALFFMGTEVMAIDNYKEYRRDHWDVELGSEYFYSDANYPSSGSGSVALPGSNTYQLLDTYLGTRYVPRRDFAFFLKGNVGSAESKDSVATRTNSSVTDVLAGLDFVMYSEAFQLIPEISILVPFEKIDPLSDAVANSEGVLELRSRLIAQKDFGSWRGYGWLGFNYRGEGRSFLMPWGLGGQLKLKRMRFGGELFGYQSVSDDTNDVSSLSRNSYINGVNAGSLRFFSANPALMDSQVYAALMITNKLSVQLNGGMTLMGSNMAAGFHVGGFLRYSFDLTEGYSEEAEYTPLNSKVPSYRSNLYNSDDATLSSEKKVRRFREATEDGVDQDLFRARPTKKPRPKKKAPSTYDDSEFQIELKGKNRRGG